ncbi:class D beta-lactamase [Nitratidesulfovibrio sp. HK-II]|uniref:class D beta-lactamase n=1 Tax=Nitratidesulfovibrio sp. HK-II TaxID=2009266 RepID=UPI001E639A4E|nr:class D beta-lactamase [Nitratidesulfovibrio sp. HK-II]
MLLLALCAALSAPAFAATSFLAREGDEVLAAEGDLATRRAPCSTFKIAISLMGYDAGILIDETHPVRPYDESLNVAYDMWKQPHDPVMWMRNSCVWYSQATTRELGMERFKAYVDRLGYGNRDVSGRRGPSGRGGTDDGLTRSWLSSSLAVSPQEEVDFIGRLVRSELPVSAHAQEMTRRILFVQDMQGGWKLYGKTGSGVRLLPDGTRVEDRQVGWFVGWVRNGDGRTVLFAHLLEDEDDNPAPAGRRSRDAAIVKVQRLLGIAPAEW